jgi:ABC-type thiamine transport system substrate-binding protein
MYVYPIRDDVQLPVDWQLFARPANSTVGEGLDIASNRERWLSEWAALLDR